MINLSSVLSVNFIYSPSLSELLAFSFSILPTFLSTNEASPYAGRSRAHEIIALYLSYNHYIVGLKYWYPTERISLLNVKTVILILFLEPIIIIQTHSLYTFQIHLTFVDMLIYARLYTEYCICIYFYCII